MFFFFSYDQQTRKFPGVAAPSNPAAFFAPFSAAELATLRLPRRHAAQQDAGLSFLQGLTGVVPRTGDQTLFLPKIDYRNNNNHACGDLQPTAVGFARRRADRGGRQSAASRAGATTASTTTGRPRNSTRCSARR